MANGGRGGTRGEIFPNLFVFSWCFVGKPQTKKEDFGGDLLSAASGRCGTGTGVVGVMHCASATSVAAVISYLGRVRLPASNTPTAVGRDVEG